jgi:nucleotide-binding universal stress UspA family protein
MEIGFSKIVVGIDGSEESMRAAEYTISVAKLYNAELIAVHIFFSGCRKSPFDNKGNRIVS